MKDEQKFFNWKEECEAVSPQVDYLRKRLS